MSFSYDPTRLDIPRNQLRLLLGAEGTSEDLKTFQDEELDYIISKNENDMNWALYDCYKMCAVKYGSTLGDSLKIGDITITDGKNKANYFKSLADTLKEDILNGSTEDFKPDLVVGGVYKSDRVITEIQQAYGNLYPSFDNQILYGRDKTTRRISYSDTIDTDKLNDDGE